MFNLHQLRIPDTVLLKNGAVSIYAFSDSSGIISTKSCRHLDTKSVLEEFIRTSKIVCGSRAQNIVTQFYDSQNMASPLDEETLRAIYFQHPPGGSSALQCYIQSRGRENTFRTLRWQDGQTDRQTYRFSINILFSDRCTWHHTAPNSSSYHVLDQLPNKVNSTFYCVLSFSERTCLSTGQWPRDLKLSG